MLATVLAAITTLEKISFSENDIPFFAVIKIFGAEFTPFAEAAHVVRHGLIFRFISSTANLIGKGKK